MTNRPFSDDGRRGGTLALFAVMLVGLLGSMALAVDVGVGLSARSEAQRVADASALAGASAFMELQGALAEAESDLRAIDYATRNTVENEVVLAGEVLVDSDWGTKEVEVTVTRTGVPAWFARFLGIFSIDVQARAVAKVSEAGTAAQCLLPFAPPDIWNDVDGDTVVANNLPDPGEEWDYTNPPDAYERWDGSFGGGYNGTGYGSNFRGGDVGMRLYINSGPQGQGGKGGGGSGGGQDEPFGPGNYLGWRMPDPDADPACSSNMSGVPDMRWNIANCNTCPISLGAPYTPEPGEMNTLHDDLQALIDADDQAYWDSGCDCVAGSSFTDYRDSPRVRPIAFFDPTIGLQGAAEPMYFSQMAWIFIEGNDQFTTWVRFVGPIEGYDEGPTTGPLVQYLRLVE